MEELLRSLNRKVFQKSNYSLLPEGNVHDAVVAVELELTDTQNSFKAPFIFPYPRSPPALHYHSTFLFYNLLPSPKWWG